jgi:hypothetical protein
MIAWSLARRLERLEAFVLQTDAPQTYMRINFISMDGKVVKTLVVKIGHGRPAKVLPRRSRSDNPGLRAREHFR